MARTTTTVRPPWEAIEKTLKKAKKKKKKATLEYIIKELADKNEVSVRRGLHLGVLDDYGYYILKDGGYEIKPPHNFMPDFLKSLNKLIEIYQEQGDFRATGLTKAAKSLDGCIITSVDDIEMYKLRELRGVGSSTLEMLEEFINDGKIERLEELKPQPKTNPDQVEWFATLTEEQAGFIQDWWDSRGERSYAVGDAEKVDYLIDTFGDMTRHECEAMYDNWMESGHHTYEPETDEDST